MNILYLHGLESKLSLPKRSVLENYGTVMAPDMNYFSNPNCIQELLDTSQNQEIQVVMGSSMGGFVGYFLAKALGVPALLFNPALPYRNNVVQHVPVDCSEKQAPLLQIVLGGKDEIIKAEDNLLFLSQNFYNITDYRINILSDLGHQIPLDVFELQTQEFFKA